MQGTRDVYGDHVFEENILSGLELRGFKGLRALGLLVDESESKENLTETLDKLSLDFLQPGKYQPRQHIDQHALDELADSIKTQGVIQPLIVRKVENNKYEIIAGERRWRAAKLAGLTHVPAIIKQVEDNVALAYALIENIQRENLNALEEAIAFERFKNEFDMTHAEIAETVGRSRTSITNSLRLLTLSEPIKKMIEEGKLDMGHARALLSLDSNQQYIVALKVIEKQLSVRETETLVNSTKISTVTEVKQREYPFKDKCNYWSKNLSSSLSTEVTVKFNDKGCGKITINVDSLDKMDWLIEMLNFSIETNDVSIGTTVDQ